MTTKLWLALAAAAFLLGGCAGAGGIDIDTLRTGADAPKSPSQAAADRLVPVPDEYRPLRVCLFAAMAIEIMTDRVRLFEPARGAETLGRLMALQGAADRARQPDPMWLNADMTDITFLFARVVFDATEDRILGYFKRGLSIDAVLTSARRVAAQTLKGAAMLRDVDAMVKGLVDETYNEQQIWDACGARMARSRAILGTLTGAGPPI